jgi:hypothetical protein
MYSTNSTICVTTEHGLPSNFGISFHLFNKFSSYTSMVQKMERVIRERWVLGIVEFPDELQEEIIKGGRGTSFKWSHQTSLG